MNKFELSEEDKIRTLNAVLTRLEYAAEGDGIHEGLCYMILDYSGIGTLREAELRFAYAGATKRAIALIPELKFHQTSDTGYWWSRDKRGLHLRIRAVKEIMEEIRRMMPCDRCGHRGEPKSEYHPVILWGLISLPVKHICSNCYICLTT